MKYILMALSGLVLISCSTTMPKKLAPLDTTMGQYYTDEFSVMPKKATPSETTISQSFTSLLLGGIVASLVRPYPFAIVGAAVAPYKPPARIYVGVEPANLYNAIMKELMAHNFEILSSGQDIGIVTAKFKKGVVKSFWIWKWNQNYYVVYELRPKLTEKAAVSLYYQFWTEEKTPLSTEYVSIDNDGCADDTRRLLLSEIDKYVISVGGNF